MIKFSFRKESKGFWYLTVNNKKLIDYNICEYNDGYQVIIEKNSNGMSWSFVKDEDDLPILYKNIGEAKHTCIEKYCEQNNIPQN